MSHKDLIVWNKSIELVEEIYKITRGFPHEELYGITSQMRRAAVAIPSNIAEGYARKSYKEHLQFYLIAFGSAQELDTQLLIAKRLKFTTKENSKNAELLVDEVCRMLNKMTSRSRISE